MSSLLVLGNHASLSVVLLVVGNTQAPTPAPTQAAPTRGYTLFSLGLGLFPKLPTPVHYGCHTAKTEINTNKIFLILEAASAKAEK